MVLVAHYDLELHQMDIKITFLNGNLQENVYMTQSEGFAVEGKQHMGCKLIPLWVKTSVKTMVYQV
jgi:hypothetical protein